MAAVLLRRSCCCAELGSGRPSRARPRTRIRPDYPTGGDRRSPRHNADEGPRVKPRDPPSLGDKVGSGGLPKRDQSLGIPLAGGVDAAPEQVWIAPLAVSSVVSTGPSVGRFPVASTVTICTPVKPL